MALLTSLRKIMASGLPMRSFHKPPQHFSDHCEPQLEHGWYLTYSSSCRGESCLRK